jgi:hypothetical protein
MVLKSAVALCALAIVFAYTPAARAADQTVKGTVDAVTDDEGNITSATVTTDDGTKYVVVMDAKGKKLAKDMNGMKAEVTGEVKEKDGENTIKVSSSKVMKDEGGE